MAIEAIIFDLDGVIVSTDDYHYLGWKQLADEAGIPFDREINHRLRGVSRRGSLEIILEKATRDYSEAEIAAMMESKNRFYRESLERELSPAAILPGVNDFLAETRRRGLKMAIGSSSRNTPLILDRIGMADTFDAVADGNDISRSKPDPEVFLLAAERLGIAPTRCLVVEDAEAGVAAAIAGGMRVLAVGYAADDPRAHVSAPDLASIGVGAAIGAP